MATGLSFLPALKTRTVAKGSASFKVLSISTPVTVVVWAITTAERVSIIATSIALSWVIFFISFSFLLFFSAAKIGYYPICSNSLSTKQPQSFDEIISPKR